jgi:actin-related protein 3
MSLASSSLPVVVCDMGTGTTRLGYAGNDVPTVELPTICAWAEPLSFGTLTIGRGACASRGNDVAQRCGLLDHGVVTDWSLYEEFWRQLFHCHLCVESSDVGVVVAEAARTSPEQRETIAEVLFETFGVAQLYVGSQALFALSSVGGGSDTALVVDSGAGVTQVVPVVEGYALNSAARRLPVAGCDLTQYTLDSLRKHEVNMEAERAWDIAERIKQRCSYMAKGITAEMTKFDNDIPSYVIHHREVHSRTGQPYDIDVGYEQFLAPETFFQPSLLQPGCTTTSLPELVEAVVRSCPIDCRRRLYENIILCGGNARFPKLSQRLEDALKGHVSKHTTAGAAAAAVSGKTAHIPVEYDVHVTDASHDLNAVWRGGSVFGSSTRFAEEAVTRAAYEERGCFLPYNAA